LKLTAPLMPYEIAFTKRVDIAPPEEYFNTCCHGGDIVADQLLPSVQQRYSSIQHNQEDWGWFIWFKRGEVGLAIDIFCDDSAIGAFRIHLSSRKPWFLFLDSVVDTARTGGTEDAGCWRSDPLDRSVPATPGS